MTILSRSGHDARLITVQCDICCPALIATSREDLLGTAGWKFRHRGGRADICPACDREARQGTSLRVERARTAEAADGELPSFIIIGAAKAGTTSLHFYLDRHPDVFMADLKELHYFQDPDCQEWLPLYREHFPTKTIARGEATTLYTRAPAIPGVAGRMAALLPDARLIYLVRDPVERALASYREERFHLNEGRSFEEAFADLDDPYNPYLSASRYAEQLSLYLEHFPREQILVRSVRDLAERTDEVLAEVFAFIGVDPTFQVDTSVRYNEAGTKFEYSRLGHWMRFSRAGVLARKLPPSAHSFVVGPARKLLRRPMAEPELPASVLEAIREALAPDAARFREMTGMTFPGWSV